MSVIDSSVRLDDKYLATSGTIYLSGIQALIRLPILQRIRDSAAGLNTAGFISGYRGSPLGGLDKAAWKAEPHLARHHIKFWPAVNEELAATAVWGTQLVDLIGPAKYDGVFALWYGKGPGVDRCGDVFKHMNHAGTARYGGVLLVAGDDHAAYSSTLPHQSDHQFAAAMIPLLYPCDVHEYLTLGLHGWAMSRFSGCAVGFKALADTVESSASISADPFLIETRIPVYPNLPASGLNARLSNDTLGRQARAQEALMQDYKIYAAMAYARENKLNHIVWNSRPARLGVVATGKSFVDVLEALYELGIDEAEAGRIGLRLFKISMPWPLEAESIREFATGLEEIVVVEEKRQMIEYQLKEQLYNWRDDVRPRVIGKFDEQGEWVSPRGEWLLPAKGDFSIAQIARVLANRIKRFHKSDTITARLHFLEAKEAALETGFKPPPRPAYYCAGCPHNRSTRTPTDSIALAGIGCHVMATAIYPESNRTMTQMGGEGATWIGQAPFSTLSHVFANLGDGTFYHSGSLAIRAAVAAGVNITYKILFNDAVAMTGGQPIDGPLSVRDIVRQVAAEGVRRIAIVAEDPAPHRADPTLAGQAMIHARTELDDVQKELRQVQGVSVLIYDQTCAAEKRRRSKHGQLAKPTRHAFINAEVCEGCGDCGRVSNCTAILPLDTELGRKRAIDQDACNGDLSCVEGFCPSFVTVEVQPTPARQTPHASTIGEIELPAPQIPSLDRPFNILITGIGGSGVITVGALLGMAAHLEGKAVSVLDMTGMSQKNGAVMSHIRIAGDPTRLRGQRIAAGETDLLLAYDMITAGDPEVIARTHSERTTAIVNTFEQPTGAFAQNRDWTFPAHELEQLLRTAVADRYTAIDSTHLAESLLGNPQSGNLVLLGFAYQRGQIPLGAEAIKRAIELNGVAVAENLRAFAAGRSAAISPPAAPASLAAAASPNDLDTWVERLAERLRTYQNARYAGGFRALIEKVKRADLTFGNEFALTRAVADGYHQLLAYKDEYEVARLLSSAAFQTSVASTFKAPVKIYFHMAPPLLGRRDANGRPRKMEFGPWLMPLLRGLRHLKVLRGTPLDIFGYTAERKVERRLPESYRMSIETALLHLTPANYQCATDLARVAGDIRGYGHIKAAALHAVLPRWRELERSLGFSTIDIQ
ncbi:MAG: indolepyruvate ferredoxin oxidoreductase family protein [Gammaproteobacteria bacterium]|nr:indolepyruvate ferredoxin oxidoreductase family protein [Gammaproteobacteria bacterium]